MLKRFLKNEKGLTLVELLAVVVILGIIAGIAVPAIGGIISKTEKDAVHASAVQVLNAAKIYVASEGIKDSSTGKAIATRTYTQADLDFKALLDNPPTSFSITITKDTTNNAYTYTNISVADTYKGTGTKEWTDADALLKGDYDKTGTKTP
ncbi:type IV pilin protein [Schinkia azotoformans]|uniref:type IV pilin protein n=1 Tax=Schinkia azotoformans TaxID=1454 RepID=UPI002DB99027|nr:prepilin-type N-terminal cleavage/methylation domain-containing protein [Schinkia azotoformans]MEC1718152.1 prepilin-type N-terminal cleavage/methylation domain-containing protein [Schinkia azotoformans]MEC1772447.1 prepilin-type N-terminal cleavage/methylation domain-containing protein [Schinkia azotoformans]MED4368359.1 prepilin-type N-terminal cleavage/methylation domain-containing protein [Schinkia azotoformans]MED4375072.1 prepilin-type N-terminal cleavage/methylation domain-containing 